MTISLQMDWLPPDNAVGHTNMECELKNITIIIEEEKVGKRAAIAHSVIAKERQR